MQRAPVTPVDLDPVAARGATTSASVESVLDSIETGTLPAAATGEVHQAYGVVLSTGPELSVRAAGRTIVATRAASCLLEPRGGDQVLLATSDHGPAFVLAVLVQADPSREPSVLSVDGDLTVRSKNGKVSVVGAEAVSLASGTEVSVAAPELSVRALRTTFFSESLSFIGRTLDAEVERLKTAARAVDRAFDRVTERVKRSYRTIDEVEHVKARELDVVVEGNASIHAENALVSADKLVKLDGEQVHLG